MSGVASQTRARRIRRRGMEREGERERERERCQNPQAPFSLRLALSCVPLGAAPFLGGGGVIRLASKQASKEARERERERERESREGCGCPAPRPAQKARGTEQIKLGAPPRSP